MDFINTGVGSYEIIAPAAAYTSPHKPFDPETFMFVFDRFTAPPERISKWHSVTNILKHDNWRDVNHRVFAPGHHGPSIHRPPIDFSAERADGIRVHKARARIAAMDLIPMPIFYPATREEIFTVGFILTPYRALKTLILKPNVLKVMEIPLVGFPTGCRGLITGRTDEVRWDRSTNRLIVCDLKTRQDGGTHQRESIRQEHCLQLHLYRRLLEDFITGNMQLDLVAKVLGVDMQKVFRADFREKVGELFGGDNGSGNNAINITEIYDAVVEALRSLPLQFHMETETINPLIQRHFYITPFEYEPDVLQQTLASFFVGYPYAPE